MEFVILVAREKMQMVMECMLTTGGLVILQKGNTFAFVRFFHRNTYLFGDSHKVGGDIGWQVVDIFVVLVRDNDYMAGVIFDPKGVDKDSYCLVDIDYVLEPEQCPLTFYPVNSEADGTGVIGVGVVVHSYIISR